MNTSTLIIDGVDPGQVGASSAFEVVRSADSPRLRRADRQQVLLEPCDFDRLVPEDHDRVVCLFKHGCLGEAVARNQL